MRHLLALALVLTLPATVSAQDGQALGAPVLRAPEPAPRSTSVSVLDPELSGQVGLRLGDTAPPFEASFGHAFAGFGMGFATGAILGGATVGLACQDGGDVVFCPIMAMGTSFFGGLTLAPLGAALATWGFGSHDGSGGNFFASLGMAYLGAGVGVGISGVFIAANQPALALILGPVLGMVLTNLGAALGYELTTNPDAQIDLDEPPPSPTVMVIPTLAPTEDGAGATAGVAGIF